jgi:DNA ligase-1
VLFSEFANFLQEVEKASKRLEMIEVLVRMLKRCSREEVDKVIYLMQGKLYPDYLGVEIGIAEKLAIRAIAEAYGEEEGKVSSLVKERGDLGLAAEEICLKRNRKKEKVEVAEVYLKLDKIASLSGPDSLKEKVNLLAQLLAILSPLEARYLMRIATGKLRLGVADYTLLDALALAFGNGRGDRPLLERAYNLSSDLGKVARVLFKEGTPALKRFSIELGRPIRPMLAERLKSAEEILEKMGGECAAEYKYDGERIQAHRDGKKVILFSRRLENISHQFPDAQEILKKGLKAEKAIVEMECVAIDPETEEMRPFQELMKRRRKHRIEAMMEEIPISLYLFDLLFLEGKDLTLLPYLERRKKLQSLVAEGERIKLTQAKVVKDKDSLENFFYQAIEEGCEGLVCKSIKSNSIYQAGDRGFLWIKYKREYKSELIDTLDLVVVGAYKGRGRRAGTYGALLLACYSKEEDVFKTLTKCGAGFTDQDLKEVPEKLEPFRLSHPHPRVVSRLEADVWFMPALVMEITGAELTLSPVHTCGWGKIGRSAGLGIRFPRFTGNFREDKSPEDATTESEVLEMYKEIQGGG